MAPKIAPWLMLISRLVLFFAAQSIFAMGFYMAGSAAAWEAGRQLVAVCCYGCQPGCTGSTDPPI
jgi:hypothetical protein